MKINISGFYFEDRIMSSLINICYFSNCISWFSWVLLILIIGDALSKIATETYPVVLCTARDRKIRLKWKTGFEVEKVIQYKIYNCVKGKYMLHWNNDTYYFKRMICCTCQITVFWESYIYHIFLKFSLP